MKFLSKHIEHAWIDAVNNHNFMLDGVTDLTARKEFVSSLQNALELIFKQYLIDRNDHSVIEWKPDNKIKKNLVQKLFRVNVDTRSADQKAFEMEQDLNKFFINNPGKADDFFTISFSKLIDKIYLIMQERNTGFNRGNLRLLNKLRNKETHFYIDENYLTFEEFKKMRNLMKDIFDFLETDVFLGFFGKPLNNDKNSLKYLDDKLITEKSYEDLVKNSKTNKDLLNQIGDYSPDIPHGIAIDFCKPDDTFAISNNLFKLNEQDDCISIPVKINEYELFRRIDLLNKYGLIRISDDSSEWEDNDGNPIATVTYVSKS